MKRNCSVHDLRGITLVGAALWSLGTLSAWAQALPGADGPDLTLPPEMRASAPPQPAQRRLDKRDRARKVAGHAAPDTTPAARRIVAEPSQPVELGVTMRGGSGTPRVYGATGTSEAIQESGSAFGAAMRFGF